MGTGGSATAARTGVSRAPQRGAEAIGADCGAADVLGTIPARHLWEWYGRLARVIGRRPVAGGGKPLAAVFLERYLSPAPATAVGARRPFVFSAPDYLKTDSKVHEGLLHHRAVYLTLEQARGDGGPRWGGVRPRWQDAGAYGWNQTDPLSMHYQALVELPLRWQVTGDDEEKDLLNSLGLGFQLRTEVVAEVRRLGGENQLYVTFRRFRAQVLDRYDFNYHEHLTVPNPDYRSAEATAVCPQSDRIRVYHSNARRLENAFLAAPFDLQSEPWDVTDPSVAGPGRVSL